MWEKSDQIFPAPIEPLANLGLRDVVTALRHTVFDAFNVHFDRFEPREPNVNFDTRFASLKKQVRDSVATQSRLEGKVTTLADGALEEPLAFRPGSAVRQFMRD